MTTLITQIRQSLQKTWDETKHPRHAEGSTNGGQFKAKADTDDPEPIPPAGVKKPDSEWDWPRTPGEKKFWPEYRAWQERQERKRVVQRPVTPAQAVVDPIKLGPGMLMPGVPKSWQKLGGKRDVEIGDLSNLGSNAPRLLRVTRWDDSQVVVIEKIPRGENQSEVEAELENELLAGRLAAQVGAEVPHTEVSGIIFRQEFVAGKTLVEEMSDRLNAMDDEQLKAWYRQNFRGVPTPAHSSLRDPAFTEFLMKYGEIDAFPELRRRLDGVQNGLVDFLMDQQDRNKANIFFGEDGHVILIDNGNTGRPGRTRNYSDKFLPDKSIFIELNAGKSISPKQREGLEAIKADQTFPEAIRFRADFLLRYGYIPFKEVAANKLWASMYEEYQRRKK